MCALLTWLWLAAAPLVAAGGFSHPVHAPLKFACGRCHQGAEEADRAGLPGAVTCRVCHKNAEAIAARPSKLPDFVVFSHARHAAAKAACASCHGEVETIATPRLPLKMKACVDCHQERKASTGCNVCHELGQ